MKRPIVNISSLFADLMAAGISTCYIAGIRLNTTQSLPVGMYKYIAINREYIERGDLVMACPKLANMQRETCEQAYTHYRLACPGGLLPLFKRVIALPGDRVEVNQRDILVQWP